MDPATPVSIEDISSAATLLPRDRAAVFVRSICLAAGLAVRRAHCFGCGHIVYCSVLKNTIDTATRRRIDELIEEGRDIFDGFDNDVRSRGFHPFIPADYEQVLEVLAEAWAPGLRFLEWGSATGVITIMADMLGYDACGIELDRDLVRMARDLAARYGSAARFAHGSFLPTGYVYETSDGDRRLGTIGEGPSGYLDLKQPLEDFDVVFGYPWSGEAAMMQDLMRCYGSPSARLILWGTTDGRLPD